MSDALRIVNPEPMTATEARAVADEIRSRLDGARNLIFDLYERKGWIALGYESWRECVVAEFDQSQRHLYRQLQAAQIEREICPTGQISEPIPERQLRPLSALPKGERKPAFEEAVTATNGKPTAKAVQEAVDRRISKAKAEKPAPAPEPIPAPEPPVADLPPPPAGFGNGVVDDPGPTEPEPEETWEPGAGPDEDADDTEEGYLESFPIRAKLGDRQRRIFDAGALLYRDMAEHRKTYQYHAVRAMNGRDKRRKSAYAYQLSQHLRIEDPKHWVLCAAPEYGGCSGTGELPMIGECQACHGRGYRIK